jgi:phosphatidyl-myo-inositol dimannoside synthase
MPSRIGRETYPDVPRVLVITNDFPPRVGGVQQYVWNLVRNLPPEQVAVLAPNWPGWREHDSEQLFAVHRWPGSFLWPSGELLGRALSAARDHRAEVVLFGHGFPAAMLGPPMAGRGYPYVVLTHGAEVWLARLPGTSAALSRVFGGARRVTAVSRHTRDALRPLVPPSVELIILYPGVDESRFAPDVDGSSVRHRHGLSDRELVLCASRLVPRKGQDVLIQSMDIVRELVPGAALLLVGEGPHRANLEDLARSSPPGSVVFAGHVPDEDLPAYYSACDVFAMPCRSRWGGLEVEGFGIVYLEAAAAGKPVVAGRSGGAEEAVVDQETGLLVEGLEPKAVALAVASLLRTKEEATRMGKQGRVRVEREFTWRGQTERLAGILRDAVT